jgi:hypothetical protein
VVNPHPAAFRLGPRRFRTCGMAPPKDTQPRAIVDAFVTDGDKKAQAQRPSKSGGARTWLGERPVGPSKFGTAVFPSTVGRS